MKSPGLNDAFGPGALLRMDLGWCGKSGIACSEGGVRILTLCEMGDVT